jgi:hypothetical protein
MRDENEDGKNLPATPLDAFDEVEDERVDGEDDEQAGRIIQGIRLMFGNDFIWTTSDDEEFPKNQELCVVDTLRCAQKWVDHKVVDTISVPPSQKWPDIEKLNADCPKSEWQKGPDGQPQGPWQRTRVAYFVDLETMQKYTYASGTVGADICVREFRDRVRTMRRFRGESVYAIVTLGDTFMPTRWGGRQRPDFKIQRWIKLGGDGGDPNALPKPAPTALPPAATAEALDRSAEDKKPETAAAQAAPKPAHDTRGVVKTNNKKKTTGKPVANVTFEEILGDEIPPELK